MGTIGVGILGLGRIAQDSHLPGVQATPGMELVAAADVTASRREKFALILHQPIHAEYKDLLARDDIDLVIVATPSRFHHEHVLAALRSGKNVMVEKPMAMSLREARAMAAEAQARGLLLTVHHNRRLDGDFQTVLRLVSEGRVGRLISVERRMHRGGWIADYAAQDYRPNWRLERDFGGGNIFDWGPHFFDQLLHLMGTPPRSLAAWLRSARWSTEVDDYFKVIMAWPDGTLGQMEASYVSPAPLPQWHLVGTEATITQTASRQPIRVVPLDGKPEEFEQQPNRWQEIYANLAAVIRGEAEPLIKLEECLAVMELIEAAVRSNEHDELVRLPLVGDGS